MTTKVKAHIAVLIANFFFGACIVAVKHITPSVMPPFALNVARVGTALLLFWLLRFFSDTKAGIKKNDIPRFIICGICGVAVNQIFFIKGASLSSPIHVSLLALSTPIAITIIAAWLLKEQLTLNKILGLLLGISGAATLIFSRVSNAEGKDMLLGDLFIILNAVSYAFYLVLVRPLMARYSPLHVTRWVFLFGATIILPIGMKDFVNTQWSAFQFMHWLSLFFVVIGATFIAYLFIVYGISHLGPSITGTYVYTQPVFATITAMVLFHEQLSFVKIVAALLIFGGVFLANKKRDIETVVD
ncbi:DMT family transporter [Parasediminibacterium paludis]|uniref:DMT family transporter n=1 Tax=Parasediminibacterium paludis TaxID=908966 RepID=A0ABV8PYK4_9BACT